jgi:hypothetical protein
MVNTVGQDLQSSIEVESVGSAVIRGALLPKGKEQQDPKRWKVGERYPGISGWGACTGQQTALFLANGVDGIDTNEPKVEKHPILLERTPCHTERDNGPRI